MAFDIVNFLQLVNQSAIHKIFLNATLDIVMNRVSDELEKPFFQLRPYYAALVVN